LVLDDDLIHEVVPFGIESCTVEQYLSSIVAPCL